MTGYTPVELERREALGLPPATGADNPPAWHDQPATAGQPEVQA